MRKSRISSLKQHNRKHRSPQQNPLWIIQKGFCAKHLAFVRHVELFTRWVHCVTTRFHWKVKCKHFWKDMRFHSNELAESALFGNIIFFTDEANFSRNSIQNFQDNHVWAEENPYVITEAHHSGAVFRECISWNSWSFLTGPFFLSGWLNGHPTVTFLKTIY